MLLFRVPQRAAKLLGIKVLSFVFVNLNNSQLNIHNLLNTMWPVIKTKAVNDLAEKVNLYLTFIDLHDF